MKNLLICMVGLSALLMAVDVGFAQPPAGRGAGRGAGARGPFGPPRHPVMSLLDENNDGALSSDEIGKAIAKLKKLDKNEDGKVTMDELPRPAFGPPGAGRPGGPGERGPGGPTDANFVDRILGLDANKDRKITKEELPERMQANFSRMDTNGDGSLDKPELESMARRFGGRGGPGGGEAGGRGGAPARDGAGAGRPGGQSGIVQRLAEMDKDEDGKLSKSELPERMQAMFDRIDSNSDGFLDKEELGAMAERFRGGRGRGEAGGAPGRGEAGAGRPKRPDTL